MNEWRFLAAAVILLSVMAMISETALADIPAELQRDATSISELVSNPSANNGKDVVIEGRIQTECPAGCWFIVSDDLASIYVDILPSNFVIPQEAGSHVRVFGTVCEKDGDPMIFGKVVEIDEEVYR